MNSKEPQQRDSISENSSQDFVKNSERDSQSRAERINSSENSKKQHPENFSITRSSDYSTNEEETKNGEANSSDRINAIFDADIKKTELGLPGNEAVTSDIHRDIYQSEDLEVCALKVIALGQYRYLNSATNSKTWLGIAIERIVGKSPQDVFTSENIEAIIKIYDRCVRSRAAIVYQEYVSYADKRSCWLVTVDPQLDDRGNIRHLSTIRTKIRESDPEIIAELKIQAERQQILAAISLRIGQSLNLETILQQTVEEVRSFLQCDRVLIYRFAPHWQGEIAVESVTKPWISVLDQSFQDTCFTNDLAKDYCNGRIQVIEDIDRVNLPDCYRRLLVACQAKANLVIPITAKAKLWGLLIAQHCSSTRQWQQSNIELLKQLATKVGIAVQQANLHQQVRDLNINLEAEVEQRTSQLHHTLQQLKQALKSEELVRSITQAVRDSLDEKQILYAATKSLVQRLEIECCQIELYKQHHSITEVIYEYPTVPSDEPKIHRQVSDYPELYQQLLAKKSLQFVDWLPTVGHRQQQATRLVCSIFDNRGILGNLWLMRPKEEAFEPWETQLVQQIADRCAIAIRQARLYEAEQIQVQELEKLNLVKDDFLKTISHELRTPMSSIRLAIGTLENLLEAELGAHPSPKIDRVMEIFHTSYKKQNQLVDDLLTLCYVDVASKPDVWQSVELITWIPQIVKTFSLGTTQKQQLKLDLAANLPPLYTDSKMLRRVVNELLNNAYKYTPSGGNIIISTCQTDDRLLIEVTNTGIEIPIEEQGRIFDKFYRIPNHDPWQHGGTGIGLALVKKLVELLEGQITVSSQQQTTTFTLAFDREMRSSASSADLLPRQAGGTPASRVRDRRESAIGFSKRGTLDIN